MIGAIRGKIIEKQPPSLSIETESGVSYELQASMMTFYRLPSLGETVRLLTHFVVREDIQLLFGFYTQEERALFRTLIKVNGVGPKSALTILSSIEPDAFIQCITNQDSATLVKLPGIGKKTAERLLIEIKDHCAQLQTAKTIENLSAKSSSMNDALSALITLGYKPQEASRALAQVKQEELSTEDLIRFALKGMVPC
ncbi:MAG: Holliday junction DNA helicase RuvA [uncultured bacterium]|nr:MAG: Holliday junction DNA helicase RuvA [uncultured bacterium]OGT15359.1 MAG: Holliday junction DNA helicase RuvA [Gammaproteobacteria bacterium RIFCSPHIGHO2_02_FULL_38_33]OGT24025.1 MAG: Holliday junction DNA helicase RuvA [Gammaproteobacteria bacterium RIFCSPHIGHO2_12_38_15]OGT69247.1 MAG: Holliday junction DNA helicase RuvA [Gammaproteobacteria bacterium RIFCSPLOWO2_02_FULL_38_11]OGT75215.1 MAG: Holliday junction DNA helicase RuvA [Gammaproteobacteria bacterium RIFCSPLOWO2_12_FULL_38_14]